MVEVVGTVVVAKVLISVFVMVYAYSFLKRSDAVAEKKPWEYLYVASMFLFLAETLDALQLFKPKEYPLFYFKSVERFLEFLFLGFLLLSFKYQNYLLAKKEELLIRKKDLASLLDKLKGLFQGGEREEPDSEEEVAREIEAEEDENMRSEEEGVEKLVKETGGGA